MMTCIGMKSFMPVICINNHVLSCLISMLSVGDAGSRARTAVKFMLMQVDAGRAGVVMFELTWGGCKRCLSCGEI